MTAAGLAGTTLAADIKAYFGIWSGTLNVGAKQLRLELHIVSESAASLFSLDQGAVELGATTVSLSADRLSLAFAGIGAEYVATLSADDTLKGTFTQGGGSFPLDFARGKLFAAAPVVEIAPLTAELVATSRQKAGIPAIGVAFARDGEAPTVIADGLRSCEATVAVSTDDQWHFGSITKSMTATLVARLIEAGGITWDTTVFEVLGTALPAMNDSYKTASFRHLLSHHAGLQPNIDLALMATFPRDGDGDPRADRLRYAGLALAQTPVGPPGQQMVYANNGYIVAAVVLETVFRQPWETLIRDHVFTPLGLTSAGFGAPGTPGKLDQPLGHFASPVDPAKLIPAEPGPGKISDNPIAVGPAGRVHMTLPDMITYLYAHCLCPANFLSADSWKTLHTPPFTGNYAMGWTVDASGRLWHNGSNTLWYAEITADPATRTVAVVACNDGNLGQSQPVVGMLLQSAFKRANL